MPPTDWITPAARLLGIACLAAVLAGCSPEVGSEAWCKDMDAKPKGDWTANEASDYAQYCVLGLEPDKPK